MPIQPNNLEKARKIKHERKNVVMRWRKAISTIKIINMFKHTGLTILFTHTEIEEAERLYNLLTEEQKVNKMKEAEIEYDKKKNWFDKWGFSDFRMFNQKSKVIFNLLLTTKGVLRDINETWFDTNSNAFYIYLLTRSLKESPFSIDLGNKTNMFNYSLLSYFSNRDDLLFLIIFLSNFDKYHKIIDNDEEGAIYADNSFLNILFDLGVRSSIEKRKEVMIEISKLTKSINNIKIEKTGAEYSEDELAYNIANSRNPDVEKNSRNPDVEKFSNYYERNNNGNYYLTRNVKYLYNYIHYIYKKENSNFEYDNIIPVIHVVLQSYNDANKMVNRNNLVLPEEYYYQENPYIYYNYKQNYLNTINKVLKFVELFKRPINKRPMNSSPTYGIPTKVQRLKGGLNTKVKKEVFGIMRCIYKVEGSRLEHIKYKKEFIPLAVFKKSKLEKESPVAKPVAKPVSKKVAKPVSKPVAKPVAKPVSKKVAKKVAKPVSKPVAKPVAKKVKNK